MAVFACHDRRLGSFLTISNTSMVLDTITNGVVYEPLARSDSYKIERLTLTILVSRLDTFFADSSIMGSARGLSS